MGEIHKDGDDMKTILENVKRDEVIKVLQEHAALIRLYPSSTRLDVCIVIKKEA